MGLVRGIAADRAPVDATLVPPWSTEPAEEQVHGVKLIKCHGDGCAKLELLALLPEFFAALFNGEGTLCLFSAYRPEPRAKLVHIREHFVGYPTALPQVSAWVRGETSRGRETYFAANLLGAAKRSKSHALPLPALWADGDGAAVPGHLPQPSVTTETSPGRHHYFWRLCRPIAPSHGEALNRRLAYTIGADRSGWDLGQLLRPPGGRNFKYDEAPVVTLVHLGDVAYDPNDLDHLLPALPTGTVEVGAAPAREATPLVDLTMPPVRLSRAARRVWDGETAKRTPNGGVDRSASLVQMARMLFEAGLDGPQLAAALAERDVMFGWEKYTR